MSHPVTKTALDRLGHRLSAGDQVVEVDRVILAQVAGVYQQALGAAKARLEGLGYPATTRVKTTGTLVEKLRREAPMRLSQMQDLAGARIVVYDRPAQDKALCIIREDCAACGRTYRVIDRRDRPSYGYRAVHIIILWDQIPIKVQIRTELQDIWAQMTERLADRWGRGIRYGEDPDSLDGSAEALKLVATRRELVASLIALGDLVATAEVMHAKAESDAEKLDEFGRTVDNFEQTRGSDPRLAREVYPAPALDNIVQAVERMSAETQNAMDDAHNMTLAELAKALRRAHNLVCQKNDSYREKVRHVEEQMQSMLQVIADRAERKEI